MKIIKIVKLNLFYYNQLLFSVKIKCIKIILKRLFNFYQYNHSVFCLIKFNLKPLFGWIKMHENKLKAIVIIIQLFAQLIWYQLLNIHLFKNSWIKMHEYNYSVFVISRWATVQRFIQLIWSALFKTINFNFKTIFSGE